MRTYHRVVASLTMVAFLGYAMSHASWLLFAIGYGLGAYAVLVWTGRTIRWTE